MTYIDLINTFWRIRLDHELDASDIGLFFAVASELNRSRTGNNLSGSKAQIGNPKLEVLSGLSRTEIWRKRNKLKQLGLIAFEKGKGKGNYAVYSLGKLFQTETVNNKVFHTETESETVNETVNETVSETVNETRYKSKEKRDKNKEKTIEDTNVSSTPKIPFQEIKKLFNSICISQSKILIINPDREKHIRARWNWLDSLEKWESYFKKIEASSFLRNSSKKNWMDFDWIINETNMTKILEGKYDDKEGNDGRESYTSPRKADETDRIKNPAGTKRDPKQLEKMLVYNKG